MGNISANWPLRLRSSCSRRCRMRRRHASLGREEWRVKRWLSDAVVPRRSLSQKSSRSQSYVVDLKRDVDTRS